MRVAKWIRFLRFNYRLMRSYDNGVVQSAVKALWARLGGKLYVLPDKWLVW